MQSELEVITPSVHPRVGGEHQRCNAQCRVSHGSSPRGRGTLLKSTAQVLNIRFIPAWAGNTIDTGVMHRLSPVHPRVGGEHFHQTMTAAHRLGSSPRGRGTLQRQPRTGQTARFIPAWAGNTPDPAPAGFFLPVHPRVGGEHCDQLVDRSRGFGSSPRGRGTLGCVTGGLGQYRFIPAWAGNTRVGSTYWPRPAVHPRVGGEHGLVIIPNTDCAGSSPRGRGTL